MSWSKVVALAGVIVAVSTAYALGAGSSRVLNSVCVRKHGGALRFASHGKCPKSFQMFAIGQSGATGSQGPPGANGSNASVQPGPLQAVAGPVSVSCATQPGVFCKPAPACSGWGNYGNGYAGASYQKDGEGFVRLRGTVLLDENGAGICSTLPSTIFYLPAGMRPSAKLEFPAAIAGGCVGTPSVDVAPDGSVTAGSPCISLNGITFSPS